MGLIVVDYGWIRLNIVEYELFLVDYGANMGLLWLIMAEIWVEYGWF